MTCKRRGTFFCVVTAPKAVLVGVVFGTPNDARLKTFSASTRASSLTLTTPPSVEPVETSKVRIEP